jgi:hypothetical protein
MRQKKKRYYALTTVNRCGWLDSETVLGARNATAATSLVQLCKHAVFIVVMRLLECIEG